MHSLSILIFFPLLCQLANAVSPSNGYPILEPVSDDGWDNSIMGRSMKNPFDLLNSEHMVWNSAAESADNIFVNMTMFTGDEELIISMERFARQLTAVNCNHTISLSFKSNSSYQSAVQSWDWVNFNEQRNFIMIANYPGCGAENSRQPWVVSNADYDPIHLTVHLNATEKAWTDVGHTYNLDFGKYSSPVSSKMRRLNINKQINLDLTAKLPATFTTSVDIIPNLNVGVACSNCGTKGTLTLAGHVETSWFKIKTFTISANPTGVEMDLNLAMSISATDPDLSFKPAPWDFFTIPLGGFEIPGLVTLGPELTLGAGFGITGVKGTATISTSVTGKIPDSSVAEISVFGDNKGATFSGWVPVWTVGPLDVSEKISSSIDVFGNAKVGVALEVVGTGVEVAFNLKIPDVTLTAAFTHDDNGVCASKTHTDGVSLALTVGADLSLKGITDLVGSQSTFADLPIFHETVAFGPPPACFGFGPAVQSSSISSSTLDSSSSAVALSAVSSSASSISASSVSVSSASTSSTSASSSLARATLASPTSASSSSTSSSTPSPNNPSSTLASSSLASSSLASSYTASSTIPISTSSWNYTAAYGYDTVAYRVKRFESGR